MRNKTENSIKDFLEEVWYINMLPVITEEKNK
jgi:hypothetical protein